ncbi:hypothetical protein MiSe_90650 [Microseira wollei NIES-4236]|uniref:Uncharacterized protein n=1 Tax=Microseira wollei NIES-4236 TaxID=2530354 RepID=A0AAV3XNY2_9CYAN|nr:hypothetical protein MiSe_90650 [Microseira wollei NIES-4236]
MPTPQNWKNYCGVGVRCRQDAYPTKLEKLFWGGGPVQAGCLPHKTGKIIVGWGSGAGRMPTPQNWKNYCGVGVWCRQDAYPTKLEKLLWGGGLVQAGCLPHKTGKIIVGWGSGAGRMPTPQNWKNCSGVGVWCRQDAYPTKLEKLLWGGGPACPSIV